MFTGSVPKPVVEQMFRIVPFEDFRDVFVCCSGSFRVDRAVKQAHPGLRVHSNDVSLLTVGLGRLLTGEPHAFRFTGRLAFIEDLDPSPVERMAALLVALEMTRYSGANAHAQAHFRHLQVSFDEYLAKGKEKIAKFQTDTAIDSFFAGDFRDHADKGVEQGGIVLGFPPTYKSGYERLYKFLDSNTEWESPDYRLFDPKTIGDWIDSLDERGAKYCVFSDQVLEGRQRAGEYYGATNKPIFLYANTGGTSLRRASNRAAPFKYTPADPSTFTEDSQVKVVPADGATMNYLKDIYLAKNIHHATGQFNSLVFVDGQLAGGIIMARSKFDSQRSLYILSDFSLSRERKLSKLIALIATSAEIVNPIRRRLVADIKNVVTTAFTDKPVSMKYRGIFELTGRKEGHLQYESAVRPESAQELYRLWWQKWGRKP